MTIIYEQPVVIGYDGDENWSDWLPPAEECAGVEVAISGDESIEDMKELIRSGFEVLDEDKEYVLVHGSPEEVMEYLEDKGFSPMRLKDLRS